MIIRNTVAVSCDGQPAHKIMASVSLAAEEYREQFSFTKRIVKNATYL